MYRKERHRVTDLKTHLVCVTKYRKPVLTDEGWNGIESSFKDVADKMSFTIEDAVSLGGCLLDVLKDDIKNQSCSERTRLETH